MTAKGHPPDEFYIRGITRTGATNQDISISVIRASNSEGFTIKTSAEITSTDELLVLSNAVATESPLEISYLEVTENGHVSAGQLINIIQPSEVMNDTNYSPVAIKGDIESEVDEVKITKK